MSVTVSAADTAPYCFLLRGSIFFFAMALLSCGEHSSEKRRGAHVEVRKASAVGKAFSQARAGLRPLQERPCHGQALALASGQLATSRTDLLLDAFGETANEIAQ